jgi:pyrroloquinoline quinone biosynthesis protein E
MNAPTSYGSKLPPPMAVLLELTHRCPLQCAYCSNPLQMDQVKSELTTDEWRSVLEQAAKLGVLQVHFSGGEPTVRQDLAELIRHARAVGLYSNLITSGVAANKARLDEMAAAGLDHVQLSIQDSDAETAEKIGNYAGAQEKKLAFAKWVREAGLPLTINAVVNRHNIDRVGEMIDLAVSLDAARVEIANVQYYGWALKNLEALMPRFDQFEASIATVETARARLKGKIVIDYVVPDYYARVPKACMNGWGQRFMNITPAGKVLPCHAAETIPNLQFDSVRERSLAEIWAKSSAFEAFRGTDWMPEPCKSCDQREIDWGGCRCQAMALTGSAAEADPACGLSPFHAQLRGMAEAASHATAPAFQYRRITPLKESSKRMRSDSREPIIG